VQTFNLPEFGLEVDLSIHNKEDSTFATGQFGLYILRDNPMKSAFEFDQGLNGQFDGLYV